MSSPPPPTGTTTGLRPVLAYTVARLGLFVVIGGILYLIGLRRFALVVVALVITMPLSYFLLRRQRLALTGQIETRVQRRQRLRAELRGDDDDPAGS